MLKRRSSTRGMRRVLALSLLTALAAALAVVAPAHAVVLVKATVTIHNIWEVNCDDNDGVLGDSCGNDYYAKVFFPGSEQVSPRAPDDRTDVEPNWQLSANIDRDLATVPIRIQLWDHDSTSGDDLIDIAPGDSNLDINLNPRNGDFSGDVPRPNIGYATGSGDDSAAIFFTVTFGETTDFDRDGLHDGLERSGVAIDKAGNFPQFGDLRALGSNPCRPTILVEVDFMNGPDANGDGNPDYNHRPSDAAVAELTTMFDNGELGADAPRCPYLGGDTRTGAQLIMVRDDLLPLTDGVDWDSGPMTGEAIRNANFDAKLRPYFHYSLWNHNQPNTATGVNTSSGFCCSNSGKDVLVSLGSWTGGVGTTREQSGTFAHELGHALGLGHGGDQGINCKPNYRSVMSYVYQTTGLPDDFLPAPTVDLNGDGLVDNRDKLRLDYSRNQDFTLNENDLHESIGVAGHGEEFFWDGDNNSATPWKRARGGTPIDWNDNGTIEQTGISADINAMSISGDQGCPNASPGQALTGHHDWANLKFKGPLLPPSAGVPSDHETTKENADYVTKQVRAAMSVADLSVGVTDSPDPVGAGTQLTYMLSVTNHAPINSAHKTVLTQTLPSQVTFASASAGCSSAGGTVTCQLGELAPGQSVSRTVTVNVPASLVSDNGGPLDITSSAKVGHDGPDLVPANDTASASTRVIAIADLSVTKTADRPSGTAGDAVKYTITVGSTGPSVAGEVAVTDDLPDPAEGAFTGATASDGGTCALTPSGDLGCTWPGALAPGETRTATVTTVVTDTGVAPSLTDRASVTFDGTDPVAENNAAAVTTAVIKAPTAIAARPATATVRIGPDLGVHVYIGELSATLTRTDTGKPVVGRDLTFTANNGQRLCVSKTDANGVAVCRGVITSLPALLSLGYKVTSTEDGRYLASSGKAGLIRIN
ncbi:DUF11 domain-containing protein [Lentzea tibetensis]|uniref:DUF11 domain-containing protein n=2 Tax=Lentzea tibetensis TaxID=2591470 RepID=A0A563EM41_9PSEU|nr:DUF11 domain-containing protein [Lentzea tibetensis]